jgi:polar amino acid transport system substrate-binding protein
LSISTNAEFPPFESVSNGKIVGVDADIITSYAESIGVSADIQDMDFDAALTSVSTYKVDVAIAGITENDERKETMDFSDSYFSANQVAIVPTSSTYASLTSADDIVNALNKSGLKIGVQSGTTGESFVDDSLSKATCVGFTNGALACQSLTNGQIDAVVIDLEPAKLYCKSFTTLSYLDSILTEEEYAIAIAKGNDSLVESINSFIKTIKENGTLASILNTYFGE